MLKPKERAPDANRAGPDMVDITVVKYPEERVAEATHLVLRLERFSSKTIHLRV
jgi:hypothetical protein